MPRLSCRPGVARPPPERRKAEPPTAVEVKSPAPRNRMVDLRTLGPPVSDIRHAGAWLVHSERGATRDFWWE